MNTAKAVWKNQTASRPNCRNRNETQPKASRLGQGARHHGAHDDFATCLTRATLGPKPHCRVSSILFYLYYFYVFFGGEDPKSLTIHNPKANP